MQTKVVSKLESGAESSGAVFNAKKTVLIHFTQNTKKIAVEVASPSVLNVGGQSIYGWSEVKLLRVVFDKKPTDKEHIAKVLKREIIAALGLKRLTNLHLKIPNNYSCPQLHP